MIRLLDFVSYLVNLYEIVIIAAIILSWLIAFNVMNFTNPFVRSLTQALRAVTEPLLAPIRRMLPDMGGLDLSPVVLLLACLFVRSVVIPELQDLIRASGPR
jgi:YggT family protein